MKNQSRKKFLDFLLGTTLVAWLGSLIYPVSKYLIPPKSPNINPNSLEVGLLEEFTPNSSKILRFGRTPIIVVRQPNGDFRAMTATCTHLDCTVQYKTDTQQLWCACHNGIYDLEGNNVSGPPPKPLTQYTVVINNNKVIVTKGDAV